MSHQPIIVEPVAYVVGGRTEPTDDYWGGTRSIIRIDGQRFTEESTRGLATATCAESTGSASHAAAS